MDNPLYKIKDWDRCFENSESRKIKNISWVPFPNKHDSAAFRRVAALKNSAEVLAAWVLLVQVASKMPVRGVLQNSSGPLTPEDLSLMTGFPERIFSAAFAELQKPGIQWILAESPTASRDAGKSPDAPGHVGTEGNRTEQKGTEQKGTEGIVAVAPILANDPLFLNMEFQEAWNAWEEFRKSVKPKLTDHAKALNLAELKRLSGGNQVAAIKIVNQTIRNVWMGFFPLKDSNGKNGHAYGQQVLDRKDLEAQMDRVFGKKEGDLLL